MANYYFFFLKLHLSSAANKKKILLGAPLDEELTRHAVQSNFTGLLCGLLSIPN